MPMLKRIDLNGSNTNDAIVAFDTQYLVRVCGRWRAGTFAQQRAELRQLWIGWD